MNKYASDLSFMQLSQLYVIKIDHLVQMIIDIAEFTPKSVVFRHWTIITMSKYYRFHDKNFLGNHKFTASHYIIGCNSFS